MTDTFWHRPGVSDDLEAGRRSGVARLEDAHDALARAEEFWNPTVDPIEEDIRLAYDLLVAHRALARLREGLDSEQAKVTADLDALVTLHHEVLVSWAARALDLEAFLHAFEEYESEVDLSAHYDESLREMGRALFLAADRLALAHSAGVESPGLLEVIGLVRRLVFRFLPVIEVVAAEVASQDFAEDPELLATQLVHLEVLEAYHELEELRAPQTATVLSLGDFRRSTIELPVGAPIAAAAAVGRPVGPRYRWIGLSGWEALLIWSQSKTEAQWGAALHVIAGPPRAPVQFLGEVHTISPRGAMTLEWTYQQFEVLLAGHTQGPDLAVWVEGTWETGELKP